MTRHTLDLSILAWQMGAAPRQPFGPAPADDRAAVREWLPARIPGDVRADLLRAGRIPPVESPAGIAAGAWADDCDWWYRAELPAACFAGDETAVVELAGVDYYSAIWFGGQRLATHEGMFARQALILPSQAHTAGGAAHELAIRIWGGGALPRLPNPPIRRLMRWLVSTLSPGIEYFPDRMAVPKAQFAFGWDFAPRLLSAGIWDEARLVLARGATIEDLWAHAEPLTPADDPTPTRWHVRLRLRRWQAGPLAAEVIIAHDDADAAEQPLYATFDLPETDEHELTLEMPAARRWWPWDQGEPHLYRVTVRLLDEYGVADEASQEAGVRTVARETLPGGAPWRWVVNGRPVFLRGANWTPADMLPGRVSAEDYADLLALARKAGVNFLRVWGGGIREKRAFWDTCDRLGIMAWQEFPLACAFLDHYPRDPAYLAALTSEARGIVRALRGHPSLIAWSGGNEINVAREHAPLAAIAAVLAADDPTRTFIPASPSEGEEHKWDVWHGYAPWATLAQSRAPFLSEFGMQALPNARSLAEMMQPNPLAPFPGREGGWGDRSLSDPRWLARKAQPAKLRHYGGPEADGDLAAAIAATQRAQATALQVGIEACRVRRECAVPPGPPILGGDGSAFPPQSGGQGGGDGSCGGVAFWQFNEPWPAVSWAVVDHARRPKVAYAMLLRSFQPLLIAARFAWRRYRPGDAFSAEIWLVNDTPRTWQGCRAEAMLDEQIVWTLDGLTMPPASAHQVGRFTCAVPPPPAHTPAAAAPAWLTLRLACGDEELAVNRYDLGIHLPGAQPWTARLQRWLSGRITGVG